jgi:outer membrane protein assembly factor BamB
MRRLLAVLFVLLLPASASAASDDIPVPAGSRWPEMRHDRRNTGAAPIESVYVPGRKPWSFKTDKGIFSTPTVGPGDRVYVGSGDGVFHAFGAGGKQLWSFKAGLIDSSAVLRRDGITIGTGDEYLYHLRTSPKKMSQRRRTIWRLKAVQPSGDAQLVNWWEGNAEVGPDGTIYAGNTGSAAYAITPAGKVKWVFRAGNSVWTSAAIADDGTTYWGSLDLFVYALDKNGKQVWRTPTLGFVVSSPALSKDGSTLYIGSFDGQLHALDAKTGAPRWAFQTGDHVYSSPALEEGPDGAVKALYIASADGLVYKVDPNGNQVWQYDTGDAVRSSPVLGLAPGGDGRIVYVGSSNGTLFALDAATGKRRWSFDGTPSDPALRDRNDMNASPALGRRGVYIGSESGSFWFVPYDWCLHARDRRCSTSPGEAFGGDLTRVFPVTAGGTTTTSGFPGPLPAATTVIGRLVVHKGARTEDASIQPLPSAHDVVTATPPFPFTAALSGDGHFLFVRPDEILDAGRDYELKLNGLYTQGGFHIGAQVIGGTGGGPFSDTIRFHTAPSRGALPLKAAKGRVPAFRLRRLAVPLPAFLPSVNQIGFDSYEWLVGVLDAGTPDAEGRGSLLAWVIGVKPGRRGAWSADPAAGFAFPLFGSYRRDSFRLGLQNITLTFSFGPVPLDRLEFSGQLNKDMTTSGPSLYAEATCAKVPNYGPFLPTTTRLCNQDGKIVVGGTYLTHAYATPGAANVKPKGVTVTALGLTRPTAATDGEASATLSTPAGYSAKAHTLSILLSDAATGAPVALDYVASTSVSPDGHQIQLKIPAATTIPQTVKAWVIADVFPVQTRTF